LIREILSAAGLVYKGVLDDRSALCLYLLEGVQDLRQRLDNLGHMQLVVVDTIGSEWVVSPVELELSGANVTIIVQNIVRKKIATRKVLSDPKRLADALDGLALDLCEQQMEQSRPSIAVIGTDVITNGLRDSAIKYFGDGMREAGAFVCISSDLNPYAGAAGVFASRCDPVSRERTGDPGLSYGFAKKYMFSVRTGDDSAEPLIDLRERDVANVDALERTRLFLVNNATRDIVVDLRAGYAPSVESTFSVDRVTLVKDKHFRGTDVKVLVNIRFVNPMKGEIVCRSMDDELQVSKEFQIEF
jgi:hypothetical protein